VQQSYKLAWDTLLIAGDLEAAAQAYKDCGLERGLPPEEPRHLHRVVSVGVWVHACTTYRAYHFKHINSVDLSTDFCLKNPDTYTEW
jgi:hypothetical protein